MPAVPLSVVADGEQHRGGEALERTAVRPALRRGGAPWRGRDKGPDQWAGYVDKMLHMLTESAAALRCERAVNHAHAITCEGGSADRQQDHSGSFGWRELMSGGAPLGGESSRRGDRGSVMHPLS